MITSNVYCRVFQIKIEDSTGTCFVIDVDGKQYLVTAKHVIENVENIENIELFHDNQWKEIPVSLIGKCDNEIDIAVLTANFQLVHSELTLEPTMKGIIWGQDAFFLGFPYGLTVNVGNMNRDYPLAFVKKGIVSNISQGDTCLLYLDGHNNPGFSGGPVVFQEPLSSDFKVAGVISGYRFESKPIYQGENKLESIEHRENTGIIISYGIKHAVNLIHANPIGCPIITVS